MANPLTTWLDDAAGTVKPKPLEQAKALRMRQKKLKPALAGEGNIFQRRKQGMDEVEREAVGP